jgi:hypothetical protein
MTIAARDLRVQVQRPFVVDHSKFQPIIGVP